MWRKRKQRREKKENEKPLKCTFRNPHKYVKVKNDSLFCWFCLRAKILDFTLLKIFSCFGFYLKQVTLKKINTLRVNGMKVLIRFSVDMFMLCRCCVFNFFVPYFRIFLWDNQHRGICLNRKLKTWHVKVSIFSNKPLEVNPCWRFPSYNAGGFDRFIALVRYLK